MIENEELEHDNLDSVLFSMRIHAEFYGYTKLMEMAKAYNAAKNKENYLNSINLNINPELEKQLSMGPSTEMLKIIFEELSILDLDFLISVASLITNEERTMLFEGMIYVGLASVEEEIEE